MLIIHIVKISRSKIFSGQNVFHVFSSKKIIFISGFSHMIWEFDSVHETRHGHFFNAQGHFLEAAGTFRPDFWIFLICVLEF